MLKDDLRQNIENFSLQDKTIEIGAHTKIKKDGNKIYELKYEPKQYLIDSLAVIGWPDPFPRPIQQGQFTTPNISQTEVKKYRDWCKDQNESIMAQNNFIYESFDITPSQAIKAHYAELDEKIKDKLKSFFLLSKTYKAKMKQ